VGDAGFMLSRMRLQSKMPWSKTKWLQRKKRNFGRYCRITVTNTVFWGYIRGWADTWTNHVVAGYPDRNLQLRLERRIKTLPAPCCKSGRLHTDREISFRKMKFSLPGSICDDVEYPVCALLGNSHSSAWNNSTALILNGHKQSVGL
jgi:hypothetical protein